MKTIYLVMMSMRQENHWSPVDGWESKKSAIESIKRAVKQDKELGLVTQWKYKIKEIKIFLDLEIPY